MLNTDHKAKNKKTLQEKSVSFSVIFKKNPKDWQDCANTGNLVWCTDVI